VSESSESQDIASYIEIKEEVVVDSPIIEWVYERFFIFDFLLILAPLNSRTRIVDLPTPSVDKKPYTKPETSTNKSTKRKKWAPEIEYIMQVCFCWISPTISIELTV
jgi:hypothetical protein